MPAERTAAADFDFAASGRRVLATEVQGLEAIAARIDGAFSAACQLLLDCRGRVVCTGMGKSGHVARKIAATLASTGTPAFYVHPGEAGHGDLGMITDADVVLALSYSGETDELITLLPVLARQGNRLIAITGRPGSTLARQADAHIDASVPAEACPLDLAPTSSTTAALVLGDALAVALLEARGFTADDFARSHPAGALGRRLLLHIRDVMHTGDEVPRVADTATLGEALMEMSRKRLGMTAVVDGEGRLAGLFTDGDLRRTLDAGADVRGTASPVCITSRICSSRRRPKAPAGCERAKSSAVKPRASSSATASASPSTSAAVVLLVGARSSGQASAGTLASMCASAWRARVDCGRPVIAIKRLPWRASTGSRVTSSSVSPELDNASTMSASVIMPRSPWPASPGCT